MSNSGEKQAKGPEKSNFAMTCNLLSQFIKEKGIVVKPGLNQQAGSGSATVGLLTNTPSIKQQPPLDCFVNLVDDDDDDDDNDDDTSSNKASTSKERGKKDPKTPQLTIFYDGKIFVFDDYPTERARDLVSMAKKGSSKMSYGILSSTFGQNPTNSCRGSTSSPREGLPPRPHNCTSSDKHVTTTHNTFKQNTKPSTIEPISTSTRAKEPRSPQTTDADSFDLPIARRSSIYRFLEKRKDRAATRGPYQVQEPDVESTSPSTCDEKFDLNL